MVLVPVLVSCGQLCPLALALWESSSKGPCTLWVWCGTSGHCHWALMKGTAAAAFPSNGWKAFCKIKCFGNQGKKQRSWRLQRGRAVCTGIASSFWGAAPQDTPQALLGAESWHLLEECDSPKAQAGQVPPGRPRIPWAPAASAPASCQPGPASQFPTPWPHKAQVLPDTKPGCLNLALLSP